MTVIIHYLLMKVYLQRMLYKFLFHAQSPLCLLIFTREALNKCCETSQ